MKQFAVRVQTPACSYRRHRPWVSPNRQSDPGKQVPRSLYPISADNHRYLASQLTELFSGEGLWKKARSAPLLSQERGHKIAGNQLTSRHFAIRIRRLKSPRCPEPPNHVVSETNISFGVLRPLDKQ
jgi:hypothetical protein